MTVIFFEAGKVISLDTRFTKSRWSRGFTL